MILRYVNLNAAPCVSSKFYWINTFIDFNSKFIYSRCNIKLSKSTRHYYYNPRNTSSWIYANQPLPPQSSLDEGFREARSFGWIVSPGCRHLFWLDKARTNDEEIKHTSLTCMCYTTRQIVILYNSANFL